MLYIRLENSMPVEAVPLGQMKKQHGIKRAIDHNGHQHPDGWINGTDMKSFAYANTIAALLSDLLGKTFLAVDRGQGFGSRYDVIQAPQLGDPVSRSFNGDAYPEGNIVKITPTWQITTDTGAKFLRRKLSSTWLTVGGTWSMISGHINERNPHF